MWLVKKATESAQLMGSLIYNSKTQYTCTYYIQYSTLSTVKRWFIVSYKRIPDKMPQDKMPQNENRAKCHRIRMHQNCNNKSYNSVTKV